eukprot:COSAG05_NODE_7192_length_844_cov_1.319463_1_plen_160_part_10
MASHVDTAHALRGALEDSGDTKVVISILEYGLEVLEAVSTSSPRKQRRAVRSLCEHVERILDQFEEDNLMDQLTACAPSELDELVQCLCEVSKLRVSEAGAECVETVEAALEKLTRCLDPVLGASELMKSAESEDRMRGLGVLRGLERVVLAETLEAEIS